MATENLAGTVDAEASVLLDENGDPIAAVVELPEGEPEAPTSEAVEIAEIEANRDITIAAIHADTAAAAIEAEAETAAEVTQMRERLAWLENETANMTERNRELAAEVERLTPPPSPPEPEPEAEIVAVIEPTMIASSETMTEASPSTETEAESESGAAVPALEVAVERGARRVTRRL